MVPTVFGWKEVGTIYGDDVEEVPQRDQDEDNRSSLSASIQLMKVGGGLNGLDAKSGNPLDHLVEIT